MRRDPAPFLWQAVEAADKVLDNVRGKDFEEVTGDDVLTGFLERQLITVGEALSQLARLFPEVADEIPQLPEVVAFRNILVHGYSEIQWTTVWRVIQEDLPSLRAQLQALLDSLG